VRAGDKMSEAAQYGVFKIEEAVGANISLEIPEELKPVISRRPVDGLDVLQ